MKGIDKVEMEHLFELDDCGGYDLRGHSLKVKVQRSRLQLGQGYFSQRAVCLNTTDHHKPNILGPKNITDHILLTL